MKPKNTISLMLVCIGLALAPIPAIHAAVGNPASAAQ
ncbi:MAG: hypothetical protein RIQ93_1787, partial [Verrucomicrobiota bacterium]